MKPEEIRVQFGIKLQNLLKEKGITYNEFATKIGVSRSNITKYVSGLSSPRMDVFLAICKCLDVEPGYFLDTEQGDYMANKAKSDERRLIESAFCLFHYGVLRETGSANGYFNDDIAYAIPIYYSRPVLRNVLIECQKLSRSRLVESEHICERIVQEYEENLKEEFDQPDDGIPF